MAIENLKIPLAIIIFALIQSCGNPNSQYGYNIFAEEFYRSSISGRFKIISINPIHTKDNRRPCGYAFEAKGIALAKGEAGSTSTIYMNLGAGRELIDSTQFLLYDYFFIARKTKSWRLSFNHIIRFEDDECLEKSGAEYFLYYSGSPSIQKIISNDNAKKIDSIRKDLESKKISSDLIVYDRERIFAACMEVSQEENVTSFAPFPYENNYIATNDFFYIDFDAFYRYAMMLSNIQSNFFYNRSAPPTCNSFIKPT